jgi:hypothetical protein
MKLAKWIVALCLLPSLAMAALTNAERKSQFEKAMAAIVAIATPQVVPLNRDQLIKDYLYAKPNKGQAVERVDGLYWRSTEHEDIEPTGDRTLEGCQLRYAKPCALLAVNDEIVAEGELVNRDMARLHFAGKYDVKQIPIIRLATRRRPDVQNYDMAMEPKAMTIHPWGKVFVSAGDATVKEAQASALEKCNTDPARKGRDGGCFVYAVNNDVVINERRMTPK